MLKKSYYVQAEQDEKLKLLASVLPGSPDEAKLVREGIDLVLEKYLGMQWVKDAIFERARREERLRPVKLHDRLSAVSTVSAEADPDEIRP